MKSEIINNQPKQAVIYCRVSTKEQVDEGNSLVSQERLCREYALKEGYEIAEIFIEKGESAKTADRKELKRMLEYCTTKKDRVQAVIAYKVDRISRNIADYSLIKVRLKKFNVTIRSVTEFFEDTPAGRFMESIIANVGQFDNEVRTERSLGGMKEAVLEGRYVWPAPPGYDNAKVNGKSTVVPNKCAPLIREAFELIFRDIYTLEEIRLMMLEKGLVNNKEKPIQRSYFFLLVRNPMYKGKIKKFRKIYQGTFEPIVSEELFDEVQRMLDGRKRKFRQYRHDNPDFPLRRFIINNDGQPLTGYWSKGRKSKYPYYSFLKAHSTIRKEELERRFMEFLRKYSFDTCHLKQLKTHLEKHLEKTEEKDRIEKVKIQKQIDELGFSIDNLIKLESKGSISTSIMEDRIQKYEAEIYDLRMLLQQNSPGDINVPDLLKFAETALRNPDIIWAKTSPEIKKRLQRFEFPQGIIFDGVNFRTTQIYSIYKAKELFVHDKSIIVHSDYRTKNTVRKPKMPPSEINLLNSKPFWEQVAKDIKELQTIVENNSDQEQSMQFSEDDSVW